MCLFFQGFFQTLHLYGDRLSGSIPEQLGQLASRGIAEAAMENTKLQKLLDAMEKASAGATAARNACNLIASAPETEPSFESHQADARLRLASVL